VYGEECLSRTSGFEWHKSFKKGRDSLQDDERKGHLSTSGIDESIEVIQKCSAEDRTLSVLILDELTGINRESISDIINRLEKERSVCFLFSSFLTAHQKHQGPE
jgi:hypothetical protein